MAAAAGLRRELGPVGVALLAISWMSPASALFTVSNEAFHMAGTGMGVALLVSLVGLVCYTMITIELLLLRPSCGGDYVGIAVGLGRTAGTLYALVPMVVSVSSMLIMSSGIGLYAKPWLPGLSEKAAMLIALGAAWLIALLNIRINEWVTTAFLMTEVAVLGVIGAVGLAHPNPANTALLLQPQVLGPEGWQAVKWSALALAGLGPVVWCISGSEHAVVAFCEELKSMRRLRVAIALAVAGTVLISLWPIAGVLVGAPDLGRTAAAERPFEAFLQATLGDAWARAASVGVVFAVFNAVIASVLYAARNYYSMARSGLFAPRLNRWLSVTHPRWGSPIGATVAVGVLALAASFLPTRVILLAATATVSTLSMLAPIACWRARRQGIVSRFRAPFFPLLALGNLACCGLSLVSMFDDADGPPALVAVGAAVLAFIAYERWVLRRRVPPFEIRDAEGVVA